MSPIAPIPAHGWRRTTRSRPLVGPVGPVSPGGRAGPGGPSGSAGWDGPGGYPRPAGPAGPAGPTDAAGAAGSGGSGSGAVGAGSELLRLDCFCLRTHLHPDLVRRLVALGLLDRQVDAAGQWWLPVTGVARVGRIERLRRDLGVTYAATGVVLDLLDRIDELERLIRRHRGYPP